MPRRAREGRRKTSRSRSAACQAMVRGTAMCLGTLDHKPFGALVLVVAVHAVPDGIDLEARLGRKQRADNEQARHRLRGGTDAGHAAAV